MHAVRILMIPAVSAEGTTDIGAQNQVKAVAYNDALDKLDYKGIRVGGLSGLTWDKTADSYVAQSDNHGSDESRVWFLGKDLHNPSITRDPVTFTDVNGTPYNGNTTDNEGIAVLPDGDFAISSEGIPPAGRNQAEHPTIRIFDANGRQKGELEVPQLFDINTPKGQASHNLTLEGLSLSPTGHELVSAMEGTLKSDVYQNRSDARRFLVYRDDVTGKAGQWTLVKQVGFHTVPGLDISDIVLDSEDSLYVLQRSWNSETGNKVALSYVSGLNGAPDVSGVANLNDPKNASEFVKSRQIGELDKLPDLGASAKPGAHQANPLMDNYEGLVITNLDQLATPDASWYRGDGEYKAAISIISDDNYSATQTTRILDVEAEPFRKTAAGFDDSASGRLSQYVTALGRNDRLDYWSANGFSDGTGTSEPIAFGGLSSTAYNRKLGQYVSAMDNHGTDVARLWLLGNDLDKAAPTGSIVLTDENGTPYNGETTDDEGLGVLPNGDFLLTSEGHPNAAEGEHEQPKIRIFGIDGRQKDELPVPELFDINCRGQAVHNKSLEALTVSPSGHQIVVGNEYALKNDSPSGKDIATTARRALVYRDDVKGAKGQWKLVKQSGVQGRRREHGHHRVRGDWRGRIPGAGTLLGPDPWVRHKACVCARHRSRPGRLRCRVAVEERRLVVPAGHGTRRFRRQADPWRPVQAECAIHGRQPVARQLRGSGHHPYGRQWPARSEPAHRQQLRHHRDDANRQRADRPVSVCRRPEQRRWAAAWCNYSEAFRCGSGRIDRPAGSHGRGRDGGLHARGCNSHVGARPHCG